MDIALTFLGDVINLTHASNAQSITAANEARTFVATCTDPMHISLTGTATANSMRIPAETIFALRVPAGVTVSVFVGSSATSRWQLVAY